MPNDQVGILDATGVPARENVTWEPPSRERDKNCDFFGWVDYAGDRNTIRMSDLMASFRDKQSGRYVLFLKGLPQAMAIPEPDAERLFRALGWKTSDR